MSEENTINTRGASAGTRIRGLRIEVTPEIIDTAVPANSGHCMISDAVKSAATRKSIRLGKVTTDLQTIRFSDLDKKVRYICFTPRVGQLALLQFDHGVKPEPFSFQLRPIQIIEQQHRERKATADKPGKGPSKPTLATRDKHGTGVPVIIGGQALVSVGLRREFGLRQMGTPSH
jgi:hypothetical protein